jgi:ribonuclease M5
MMEKIKVPYPVLVEGKYDKNTLLQIIDASVIPVGGFSVFNSAEKKSLIRKLAEAGGIIVLMDSDGGGKQIRSYLSGIIPKEKIYNLYIPKVEGKEKRKTAPSKEGLLGVEGMGREELIRVLAPFVVNDNGNTEFDTKSKEMITKVDFYKDKLTGAENSAMRRDELAKRFDLPSGMSANALLEALNIVTSIEEYRRVVDTLT